MMVTIDSNEKYSFKCKNCKTRHEFVLTKPLTLHCVDHSEKYDNHLFFITGTNHQLNIVRIALITNSEEMLDFAGSVNNVKAI